MSDIQSLISMGYSRERAEEALTETANAGIEVALEYLLITDEIGVNDKKEGCTRQESGEKSVEEKVNQVPRDTQASSNSSKCKVPANSNIETHIRVRLLNGKQLSKTFDANDKLNDILLWIQSMIPSEQFGLMTTFPKKVFTSNDYEKSLDSLNLVPSAVLIATQPEKWNNLKEQRSTPTDDENRKVEEKKRKEEIEKRMKEMEEERLALERVRTQIEGDKAARRERWPSLYKNSDQEPAENQKR